MADRNLKLETIEVTGLFGSRDYRIPLNERRPTILTGRNGTGKSTILRLVNAVAEADVISLVDPPLSSFRLHFANAPSFSLFRQHGESVRVSWNGAEASLGEPSMLEDLPSFAVSLVRETGYRPQQVLELLQEGSPYSFGVPIDEWVQARNILQHFSRKGSLAFEVPDLMSELARKFHALYVTDQRLVAEDRPETAIPGSREAGRPTRRRSRMLAIEVASSAIADEIRRADSLYARTAQEEERSFPNRVLKSMLEGRAVSDDDLGALIESVDRKREQSRIVGLLDRDQRTSPELPSDQLTEPHVRAVMATILRSSLKNMSVLDDLANRLTAYKQFLDRRFSPKQIVLDRSDGIKIQVPWRFGQSRFIKPGLLSSGEQQLAVLAYEILFRAGANTLMIIDEPEISLHLIWQDSLVSELSELAKLRGANFLMATHSPAIVASVPECEFSLDGDEDDS